MKLFLKFMFLIIGSLAFNPAMEAATTVETPVLVEASHTAIVSTGILLGSIGLFKVVGKETPDGESHTLDDWKNKTWKECSQIVNQVKALAKKKGFPEPIISILKMTESADTGTTDDPDGAKTKAADNTKKKVVAKKKTSTRTGSKK